VAGGLKRVAGNKRLYRDLLLQFAAKQGDANAQISAAIESGDRKLAERIAHTVKGVAGNIGLGQISAAAERLEIAIRDADTTVPALLEEFSAVLRRQVKAIQQGMQDFTPEQQAEGKQSAGFDARATSAAIARLRALLESSDADAAEAFLALECTLQGISDKPRLAALGTAISEFDFDAARTKLDEITKEYGGI